mgnify:CR=1 FL=1
MKKSLALMLALIMALCMIPTTAFAADIIDQKNSVSIYKGEPTYSYFLRNFPGGSITKQKNEEVTWQRLPRYTNICNCGRVLEEVIPDLYCINPDKNIKITNPEVIGEYGVRVASWKGNDVYNGYPCFEFYCKAAKAGETDVTVTYYYNYNYRGATGYCNYCGNRVTVPAQTNWYEESVTFHVKCETQEPPTDNPPAKPDPRPSVTPTIDGLTGVEVVEVKCITKNSGHAEKSYQLIADSYEVGDVKGDAASGYTCDITVEPEKYVKAYNTEYSGHTLETEGQIGTIKLVWDNQKWKLATPSGVPVVFDVKCETQEPPTDKPERPEPENTSKPFIELTGEEAVKVHCTNDKANHDDKSYGLMHDGYTVGDVKADATNGYTCDITVNPDKYVDQYNLDIEVEHKLDPESQTGTIKLVWDKENQKWKLANPSDVPVVFDVKCDNTQPPLDNITIEVSKTWHDDSNTVPKLNEITVLLLADGKEVDRATIPDVNGAWSHSFGAKPANDNGKPINYTVKEENVPDWTPYYYTAGLWKGKLIFQIHNVPTVNTREIKVTKKVSGEGADTTKEFNFKVTLLEYHDNAEVTDQPGYYPLGGTYTFGGVTFTNGVATFKLKDGDSKEITGIPTHIYSNLPLQYKVEEVAPSGYTVKVNGSAGSSINGAFTDAKTVNIAFENIKESGTNPTPTPTPGGGNGGHWHPTTTPVPVIVIPPKTGDMTIWQSILHFLGIR